MPPIQIIPQDRPSNIGQDIQLMNQSFANLARTIEQQRQRNQDRTFANIISTIDPKTPSGEIKSDVMINKEIMDKINADRQSRGKPNLFNFLDTTVQPLGLSPIEQAVTQAGLQGLLTSQTRAREEEDRQLKRELITEQIGATKALAEQRTADAETGGVSPATTSAFFKRVLDTTKDFDIITATESAIAQIRGSGFSEDRQEQLLNAYYQSLPLGQRDDALEVEDIINNKRSLRNLKRITRETADTVVYDFESAGKQLFAGRASELKDLAKDKDELDNIKFNMLKKLKINKNAGTVSNHLLALKANIRDADIDNTRKLTDKELKAKGDAAFQNIDFLEDNVFQPLSFINDTKEDLISDASSNPEQFNDLFDELVLNIIQESNNKEEAATKYNELLNKLEQGIRTKTVDRILEDELRRFETTNEKMDKKINNQDIIDETLKGIITTQTSPAR